LDAINNRKDVKDTEKFLYCLLLVVEPALSVIKHIEVSSQGYKTAIDFLQKNYDNPVLTVMSLCQRLLGFKAHINRYNLNDTTNQLRDKLVQ
jgi:Protein of unknown function (DUF1759)